MHHLDLSIVIADYHSYVPDTALTAIASLEEEEVAWLWVLDFVRIDCYSTRGTGNLDPL